MAKPTAPNAPTDADLQSSQPEPVPVEPQASQPTGTPPAGGNWHWDAAGQEWVRAAIQ